MEKVDKNKQARRGGLSIFYKGRKVAMTKPSAYPSTSEDTSAAIPSSKLSEKEKAAPAKGMIVAINPASTSTSTENDETLEDSSAESTPPLESNGVDSTEKNAESETLLEVDMGDDVDFTLTPGASTVTQNVMSNESEPATTDPEEEGSPNDSESDESGPHEQAEPGSEGTKLSEKAPSPERSDKSRKRKSQPKRRLPETITNVPGLRIQKTVEKTVLRRGIKRPISLPSKNLNKRKSLSAESNGGIRRDYKFRQNTIILRDMRRQQKIAHLKRSFPRRMIRRLIQLACIKACPDGLRIQKKAIDAIHESAESYLVDMFRDAGVLMVNEKRQTLLRRHLKSLQEIGHIVSAKPSR